MPKQYDLRKYTVKIAHLRYGPKQRWRHYIHVSVEIGTETAETWWRYYPKKETLEEAIGNAVVAVKRFTQDAYEALDA